MPRLLFARPPRDPSEERQVHKLAGSRHAPADWILRARMITRSWTGERTTTIAAELSCHPQTVRERLARFNAEGIDGLGDRPGGRREPRLSETERGALIALARAAPPRQPVWERTGALVAADPTKDVQWSLDALVRVAHEQGIRVERSQVRHILPYGGCPPAPPAQLGRRHQPQVRPKRTRVVALYTDPPVGATTICVDELGPITPRTFPPTLGWSADGHRIKAPLEYSHGRRRCGCMGRCVCGTDGRLP